MADPIGQGSDAREPKSSGGRPRSRQIDEALITATLAILDAEGYVGVSLEAVAKRAGTSRPAIYRRWSGRAPLVLAAVASRLDIPAPPDTGCTLCDMDESFNIFLGAYRTIRPEALSALYAECAPDPELRTQYLATIIEPARTAVGHTLDRAVARGDLRRSIDRDLLLDIVGSLVHYRAMFYPDHLGDAEAEHALEVLLQGVAVDYPALVAHSEALEQKHLQDSGTHHLHASRV
ncbi:MAG TPA: TetR/AcrR family transcriptional regulator [Jiangellaceae bacterium]|nr:TetR/AcrR family transcriptional regulator [Jiangellaceae bacterium]